MKKFRVEFNTTGFYSGQGIWEVLDETAEVEAETAQDAMEYIFDYMVETDEEYGEIDTDEIKAKYEEYAWRAAEIIDGEYDSNNWEFRD